MAKQLQTISVDRLRELLEDEDGDALVIFSTDYGDYHHTPQALPIDGEIEQVVVVESAYSNSGFRLAADDRELTEEERAQTFLVIR